MGHIRHFAIAAAMTILAIEGPLPTHAQTCDGWQELDSSFSLRPSIAINADLALVGDGGDNEVYGNGGAVYSHKRIGTTWVEEGKFTAMDVAKWAAFGEAMALEGDLAAIGAPSGHPVSTLSGAVYMFRRIGDEWVQEQKLSSPNAAIGDEFGGAVAIGDTIILEGPPVIVGAPHDSSVLEDAGRAYIFQKTNDTWYVAATLTGQASSRRFFGESVAISGNRAVVGGKFSQYVYVFERVGGNWVQQAILTPIDGQSGDRFGRSVSIDGDYIAVGAPTHIGFAGELGVVYVYRRSGSTWIPTTITQPDAALGAWFGSSVRLDGTSLLISAPYKPNVVAGGSPGSVYLYERSGTAWFAKEQFVPSGARAYYYFGDDIALDGNRIMARDGGHGGVNVIEPHDEPWPDCNENLEHDDCELLRGAAEDCLGSGRPDACDVADGVAEDCNGNDIPDECEPDCNGSGIPDDCDTANGTSEDCNLNAIPDECEPDCNQNNLPDSCDIANETSEDCTADGIPDECEPDCNANGIADICDIADGTSSDCDKSRIPDECEGIIGCRRINIVPVNQISGVSFINGNSIEVIAGNVVELNMLISEWTAMGTLTKIEFQVDGAGFDNGVGVPLLPVGFAMPNGCPASGDTCDEGGFIKAKQGVLTGCDCTFGPCEDPPACTPNLDYVFRYNAPTVSVFQDTTDYFYRSVAIGDRIDEGIEEYCGSLRLDIPPGAAGTYTIDLVDDPDINSLWNGDGRRFPIGSISPATITILVRGACCAGPSCSDLLESECATIGGTFLGTGTTCDQGDANGDGVPDECDNIPGFAISPHDIPKNRFLSIDPRNDPAEPIALKVELLDRGCSVTGRKCTTSVDCRVCFDGEAIGAGCSVSPDCPGSFCVLSGETCEEQSPPVLLGWVADPVLIAVDESGRIPADTYHSLLVPSQPAPRAWTEEVVHIGDCQIAPAQAYAISATADGVAFKSPLVIDTVRKPQGKFWGDVVGSFDGTGWTAANGLVSVDDVTAVIKFITLKPAPHITVVDLGGEVPNWLINASDLQFVLGAFKGNSYPPVAFTNQGGPADCP